MLDLFATVAEDLYQRYGGREDEKLQQELYQIVRRYFAAGLDSLVY